VEASSSKILIVDDALEFCEALKSVLDNEGFDCKVAGNGQEAIDLLADHETHLILLDWEMPVMSGADFLKHRGQRRELLAIPVIVLSASVNIHQLALSLGATGFLQKPVDFQTLLEKANSALNLNHWTHQKEKHMKGFATGLTALAFAAALSFSAFAQTDSAGVGATGAHGASGGTGSTAGNVGAGAVHSEAPSQGGPAKDNANESGAVSATGAHGASDGTGSTAGSVGAGSLHSDTTTSVGSPSGASNGVTSSAVGATGEHGASGGTGSTAGNVGHADTSMGSVSGGSHWKPKVG
jgi:CheY-like chemotaxis protein